MTLHAGPRPLDLPVLRAAVTVRPPAERVPVLPASRWWLAMEAAITALLVLVVLMATADSIGQADWVEDLPDLRGTVVLALITAMALAALPAPWWALLPGGVVLGGVTVLGQVLTVRALQGQPLFFARFEDLGFRLEDWFRQAFQGGITTDNVPFILFIVSALWLGGFLGTLAVQRGRSPWLLLITFGVFLSVNVSYLDGKQWDGHFAVFAGGAVLLLMRTHLLRRMDRWRAEGTPFPERLTFYFLAVALVMAVSALALTRALPRPDHLAALTSVWRTVTSPLDGLNDDLSRIFSGIDSSSGAAVHSFRDTFVLQGAIDPGDRIVLRVEAPAPGFLRGAAYDRYNSRGWQQSDARGVPQAAEDAIPAAEGDPVQQPAYQDRVDVTVAIAAGRSPDVFFTFGQPVQVDRAATVLDVPPPAIAVRLGAENDGTVPPALVAAAREAQLAELRTAGRLSASRVAAFLPPEYDLVETDYNLSGLTGFRVRPRLHDPDVLGVRAQDDVRAGFTYTATGSISAASAESLRAAGTDYPAWITERYLQLPASVSDADFQRLAALARRVVVLAQARTPYDAAAALERYLCCTPLTDATGAPRRDADGAPRLLYPHRTDIEAPPPFADVVSWFLFDHLDPEGNPLGGYYDYHASALTVLLRTLGVPARVSTGFRLKPDSLDERTESYLVRGSDAYAWVEVFFPGAGWVEFDPTSPEEPGLDLPEPLQSVRQPLSPRGITSDIFDEPLETLEEALAAFGITPDDLNVDFAGRSAAGGWSLWWVAGPLAGLGMLAALMGMGRLVWLWSLRGVPPAERIWTSVQRFARWSGVPVEAAATPRERAARIDGALNGGGLARMLADRYAAERFGRHAVREDERPALQAGWRRLRRRFWRRRLGLGAPSEPPEWPD